MDVRTGWSTGCRWVTGKAWQVRGELCSPVRFQVSTWHVCGSWPTAVGYGTKVCWDSGQSHWFWGLIFLKFMFNIH